MIEDDYGRDRILRGQQEHGSVEAVTESIAKGRLGVMPAFGGRLDETQIRLLVALLTVNSDPELPASP